MGDCSSLGFSSWFHHHSVSIRDRILRSPCWAQTEGVVKEDPELVSDGTVGVQHHTRFDMLGVEPRTSCMLDKHAVCKCIPRPPHLWLLFSGVPNASLYSTRDYVSPLFSHLPDSYHSFPFSTQPFLLLYTKIFIVEAWLGYFSFPAKPILSCPLL